MFTWAATEAESKKKVALKEFFTDIELIYAVKGRESKREFSGD